MNKKKLIVAVSGASGSIYAKQLLMQLKAKSNQIEDLALIFSKNALKVWEHELNEIPGDFGFTRFENSDMFAAVASGSANYTHMVILPCSMGMIGRIANGIADDLISRAADVMLKEQRKLIVVPRESPFNLIHIENLKRLNLSGAIICPANPSFYSMPKTIEDLANTVVHRIIDLLDIQHESFRWGKPSSKNNS